MSCIVALRARELDVTACTESALAHATAQIETTKTYAEATLACTVTMIAYVEATVACTIDATAYMCYFETLVTTPEKRRIFFYTNYYFQASP